MDISVKKVLSVEKKQFILSGFYDEISLLEPNCDAWIQKLASKASMLFAVEDGSIRGFVAYYDAPEFVYITLLMVSPLSRGKGIAQLLVNEVFQIAIGKKIRLEVDNNNLAALALYQKLGFTYSGAARQGHSYYEHFNDEESL